MAAICATAFNADNERINTTDNVTPPVQRDDSCLSGGGLAINLVACAGQEALLNPHAQEIPRTPTMARNEHVLQFTHGYNRVSKSTSPAFTLHKIDGKQSTTADELEMMPLTNIVGSEPASAKVRYIRTSQPMCCNFCGVIVVCVMVIIIGSGSIPAILQHIRSAGIGQQEMDYLRRGPLGFVCPSILCSCRCTNKLCATRDIALLPLWI